MRRCAEPATHTRALFGGDPAGMHEYRGGSKPTWQAILLRRGVKQVCSGLRYVYLVYRGRQRLSKRTRVASVTPLDSKDAGNYVVEIPCARERSTRSAPSEVPLFLSPRAGVGKSSPKLRTFRGLVRWICALHKKASAGRPGAPSGSCVPQRRCDVPERWCGIPERLDAFDGSGLCLAPLCLRCVARRAGTRS